MAVIVKCPKCKMSITLSIPRENLKNSPSGLTPIAFPHGNPKHILVIYFDREGNQRGYEILDSVIELGLNIDDIIKILGKKNIARFLAAVIQDAKIFIRIDTASVKLLHKLLILIGNRRLIKVVPDPKIAEYKFDFISGRSHKVPGEKYFLNILNKVEKLGSNEAKLALLESSISKIDQILFEIDRILEQDNKIFYKSLKAKLGIGDDLWKLIEAILVKKGYSRKIATTALEVILNE